MGNTYKQTFNRFELFTFTQPKTLLSIGIFILIGFFTNNVCAQVSAYTFTQSGGTYTPITGGTVFTQTGTVTSPTSLDDNSFNALPIGFSFNYHGNSFTTFGVNANGFITLGGTAASSYDALTVNNESIAALNDDLLGRRFFTGSTTSGNPTVTMTAGSTAGIAVGDVASGTGIAAGSIVTAVTATTVTLSLNATSTGTGRNIRFHNGTIRYETIGTAPNRTLVVQWSNFSRYTTNAAGDFFNFQIRLNECSNTIETVYDLPFINTTTSITTQVGLRGAAGTDFNNRATTTNWSATTAGGTNGATCTLTPTVFPASGTTFTWTPNFVDVSNISINTGTPYCQGSGGSNAIDIFTCSQTSTWTISPTTDLSVTSGTGNGSTVANPNTTTTYTVTSTDGVSSATSTFTVTVTPTPNVTPRNYEICKDATAPTGTIFTSAAITCPAVLPVPNAEITSLGNVISGTLTAGTDPTALRLTTSIANSSTCSFDASITRNYQAISFTVSYPGNYTFTMSNNTGADFMGYLVSGAFTPGSCASGTFLRGDDDSEPNGDDPMLSSVALVAGTTYTLITTTWSSTSGTYSGSYTWNVTTTALAPGQVEWYDAASGGTLMGTGLTFNPFAPASGTALTTATAGSTDYFARCTGQTCNDTATVIVKPLATSTQSATACVNYTWSATGTTYTSSGTYTHTFTGGAANGCDSTATLNLTILNPASGTQTTSACVNYTWSATGTTYTSSGTYTHTFTGGAANGCDSTATLNLTILNPASGTQTTSACVNYTWSATGTTYTSSGTYTHTFTGGAANGCDSTATLNLTILNPASGTQTTSACVNYTWSATGTTYTSSGTYTHTFTGGAANGCDSTATLNLTILNPASGTQTTSACVNYTWSATGTTYTSSGTYTHTFTGGAANGCDSTATLNLTILNPASGSQNTSACVNYTWSANGTTYTSSGTYTHTFTGGAANGCDSTATLNLTILNPASGTQTTSACVNYTWSATGTTYTSSGTYTHTFTGGAANGCDSTATLNLTILNPASGTQTTSACVNYTWSATGTTYTSSGTYTHTFTGGAANGCDSTATLNLTILNPASGTQTTSACVNYTWSATGTTYTSSGTYTHTFTGGAANGCDSTATLNLTILNPASGTQTTSACVNYTWSATGTTYTSSGTYTHTFTGGAANGCDSTATLNLTILNPASGTQTTSACVNYTWSATGTTYTSSGTYTHTFTGGAANGCDSTVTLNLTINNSSTGTETATACDTYTWATNGATYTMSGSYPYTIVGGNAAGCDSTVTLNLTINTTPASTTDLSICRGASAAAGLTAMGCNTINGTTSLGNTISGTILTAGTTAVRMISSTNSSTCGYSANVRPYDVQSFTVNLSGNYNFTMSNSGAFDGMAYIYSAPMVIGTCGTGFVRSDDDSEPTGDEPMMTNVPLVAGTTYFLVSTTFDPITADQPFTWTVTGPSSTNTNWFTTATGGVSLANVNMFNPVGVAGSGLANTNTPGVYTYYAACGVNDCRTPASLKIFDVPSITSAVPTCAPNATITVTSPALNNANHTGADIGLIEYSIDGGAYQASNVFTGVSAGSHTITVRNSANPACASASTNVFVPNTPTTTDAVACQGGGITPIVGLQASGCTGTISASATVNMTFNGTQNNSESNSSATPTTIATGTLNIPAGSTITSVTISVPGTNSDCVNNSYQSEIRFQLSGALVADATSTFSSAGGTGSLAACGAYDYVKTVTTGTTLGTGSTLNLNYWNSFNDNTTGPDATFTSAPVITVLYNAPIVAQWYTASSGGTPIATGNTMNPLITSGSGVTNTNTPGVTTYYTACSGNTICTRTPVNFKVYDKPDITSVTSSAVSCLNETTITVNATIDNANHTGGDIGSIEYSFDNGNSWQPSNTFVGAPNTTYQIRTLNTARPVCFNSSSITTGSALGGPLASTSTCGTCTIADGQGAYTFVNSSGDYIASVSDVAGDGDLGVTNTCVTIDPSPTTLGSSTYLNRHWDIDPTNTSNDGCVTVYFTDAELTALRTASGSTAVDNTAFTSELCISLYHGGAETPGNNTSGEVFSPTGAGAGSVTYTANTPVVGIWSAQFCATSFSGVYCHTCNPIDPSVLPVTLVSFDGKNMGDKNHLYWTTSSELNTSHFEILKSVNGRDFFRIGNNVPAAGNSSTNKDYTLVDNNPRNGHNYYRLKTVDQNGAFQLSNTIDIYLKSKLQVKVQPNPANSFIQVLVNGPEDKLISIEMIDAFGRVVQSKSTAIDRFTTSVNFDLSGLANAVYTIRVTSDVESSETRFIKQ